jgi:transcriptional regulator with XRE-family HTH domain
MSHPELIEPDEIGAFLRRARELRGWSQIARRNLAA